MTRQRAVWRYLILTLCLAMGLAGRPVWADEGQVAQGSSRVHRATDHTLVRTGDMVTATLRLGSGPQRFTLPAAFRPAMPVIREAEVWDAPGPGGTGPGRHQITVYVERDGTVRYVNSAAGMDGRAKTTLAWSLSGFSPRVCERSLGVQKAIRETMRRSNVLPPACEAITWADLAAIRTLGRPMLGRSHVDVQRPLDLVGLVGLEFVSLRQGKEKVVDIHWLAHTPHLTRLELYGSSNLPGNFLAHTPHLTHLELYGSSNLPGNFLAHTPHLTHLEIHVSSNLPGNFLAHTPHLTHLGMGGYYAFDPTVSVSDWQPSPTADPGRTVSSSDDGDRGQGGLSPPTQVGLHPRLTTESGDFLAYTPQLIRLKLSGYHAFGPTVSDWRPPLATDPGRIASSSDDEAKELASRPPIQPGLHPHLTTEPGNVLVPPLQPTLSNLHGGYFPRKPTTTWPGDVLSYTPRLTHLTLNAYNPPKNFLIHTPRLTHLTLWAYAPPADLLAHTPRLTHLNLQTYAPPADLLAHTPRLTHLKMSTDNLAADLLAYMPRLTDAALDIFGNPPPSPDFLAYTPQLTHLDLLAHALTELPTNFLAYAPRLTSLKLYADSLTKLPADFLVYAPRLTSVTLHAPNLTELPTDFLAYAPRLTWLGLIAPHLTPRLVPDDPLWTLLREHGEFAVASATEIDLHDSPGGLEIVGQMPQGTQLQILARQVDALDGTWLRVFAAFYSIGAGFDVPDTWVHQNFTEPGLDFPCYLNSLYPRISSRECYKGERFPG